MNTTTYLGSFNKIKLSYIPQDIVARGSWNKIIELLTAQHAAQILTLKRSYEAF